jgi:hypothetical protein
MASWDPRRGALSNSRSVVLFSQQTWGPPAAGHARWTASQRHRPRSRPMRRATPRWRPPLQPDRGLREPDRQRGIQRPGSVSVDRGTPGQQRTGAWGGGAGTVAATCGGLAPPGLRRCLGTALARGASTNGCTNVLCEKSTTRSAGCRWSPDCMVVAAMEHLAQEQTCVAGRHSDGRGATSRTPLQGGGHFGERVTRRPAIGPRVPRHEAMPCRRRA